MSKDRQDFFADGKNLSFRKSKSRYNLKETGKKGHMDVVFTTFKRQEVLLK